MYCNSHLQTSSTLGSVDQQCKRTSEGNIDLNTDVKIIKEIDVFAITLQRLRKVIKE